MKIGYEGYLNVNYQEKSLLKAEFLVPLLNNISSVMKNSLINN